MKKSDYLKIGGLATAITAVSALNVAGQNQEGLTKKIDNLKKQKQFYILINQQTDLTTAEHILRDLVKNNLEANTGGQFIPAKDSAVYIGKNGEFRSRIMQASELTADHPNADKYKWLATTLTDFSTQADMTNAETKELVMNNYTVKENQIKILHNKKGNRVEIFIQNYDGKILPLSKHIHRNKKLSTDSHLLYEKLQELDVKTVHVGRAMGFMPKVVGQYESVIDSLENKIDNLEDSLSTYIGDLSFAQEEIESLQNEIDANGLEIENLNNYSSLWKAGVMAYNNFNNSNLSFEAYSTLPIFGHGVKIGLGYTLVKDAFKEIPYTEVEGSRYLNESPNPKYGDAFGFEEEKLTQNISNNHEIYGILGIGLGKGFFLNTKAGVYVGDELNERFVNSTTGFQTKKGDQYDVNTTKLDPEQTQKEVKQLFAGIGLEKFIGPIVLGANGLYNFDTEEYKIEAGAGLDLVALYNIFK